MDSSGKITRENILLAMQKVGREMTSAEVNEIIKKHDITGDGQLDFKEFKAIFFEGKELEDHDHDHANRKISLPDTEGPL